MKDLQVTWQRDMMMKVPVQIETQLRRMLTFVCFPSLYLSTKNETFDLHTSAVSVTFASATSINANATSGKPKRPARDGRLLLREHMYLSA